MIFIAEDALAIRAKIDHFMDNGNNPLLQYKHNRSRHFILKTGSPRRFGLNFNPDPNNKMELILPDGCQYLGHCFKDEVSINYPHFNHVKIFDYSIEQEDNKLIITIIPTPNWYAAVEQRSVVPDGLNPSLGRISIGYLELKFTQPGEFEIPGVAGAVFTVEGEAATSALAINEASNDELQALQEISGVGPATVQGIIDARNEKPFSDQKDLERAKYVGTVRAKQIMEFPVTI